jgi:hypothetical protein
MPRRFTNEVAGAFVVLFFGGSLLSIWISYCSLFRAWPLLLLNLQETTSGNNSQNQVKCLQRRIPGTNCRLPVTDFARTTEQTWRENATRAIPVGQLEATTCVGRGSRAEALVTCPFACKRLLAYMGLIMESLHLSANMAANEFRFAQSERGLRSCGPHQRRRFVVEPESERARAA